jgi:hypothetical protein
MKKILYIMLLMSNAVFAQYSFNAGNNNLEVSGLLNMNYNNRFYLKDHPDNKADVFKLATARFKIEGRVSNDYEYKLQLDMARLGYSGDGEFPALLDANFTIKKLKFTNITMGYQKIPYSRSSLTGFEHQTMWQRGEVARGQVFSRRDLGVVLSKDYWKQRVNVMLGAFTGQGENIMTDVTGGDNDASGKLEYVGRVELSYPSKFKYNETLDLNHSDIPKISLGLNGRYVERQNTLQTLNKDPYGLKIIGGEKTMLGMDLAANYKGFSFLFEAHNMNVNPTDKSRLQGLNKTSFNAIGSIIQLSYYNRILKSAFTARYDDFIPNDLIPNSTMQTLSGGYNFLLDGYSSMLRVQYWYRLDRTQTDTYDQIRIGWQQKF